MTVHVVKFIDTVFSISSFFNCVIKSPDIFMKKHLAFNAMSFFQFGTYRHIKQLHIANFLRYVSALSKSLLQLSGCLPLWLSFRQIIWSSFLFDRSCWRKYSFWQVFQYSYFITAFLFYSKKFTRGSWRELIL